MFDSHCHLNFPEFQNNLIPNLEHCLNNGIDHWMIPGINLNSLSEFQQLITLTTPLTSAIATNPINMYFALGLHPYFIEQHQKKDIQVLSKQIESFNIQAIGETGLDATCTNHNLQTFLLIQHFELAKELKLPIILHHRKTLPELLRIAKRYPSVKGVIHAFSGSFEQAKQWIDIGYYLGVGGTITYDRAIKTRNAITRIDLKHLLIETDAPSMPIFGQQGKINAPINLIAITKSLSELKSIDFNSVDDQCSTNAKKLFGEI
ncbi:MAG: TatD family hydrolase [Saccharospirillaceae bacterium]|nr:TatD family hydrolase [Pseudomonadales bacterium]NRB81465.1 TatD family hydrolase [Saccharospirillaceae bacterium]